MSNMELIIAEIKARQDGNNELADLFQRARWDAAMGLVVNTSKTGHKPSNRGVK